MARFLLATMPITGHTTPGLPIAQALVARGHDVRVESGHGVFAFGGAQLVLRQDGHYVAGSDPRKDGGAVAF